MLPKLSGYTKIFDDQTRCMSSFLKDDKLLEKCNKIWDKVASNSLNEGFDSEPVYNKNI